MNGFTSNSEVANSSLPDSMLSSISVVPGTLLVTMDATAADPVIDVLAPAFDVRMIYAAEITIHPLAN